MAKRNPAASDWALLPPGEQQLETGWVGYRHVTTGMTHWHHAAADEDRLSAALVLPTPADDDSGISHALAHMVLRGSSHFTEPGTFLALRAELALLTFNATTHKENTRFHLSGYDPTSALRGLGFMADCVFQPLLQEDDFNQEVVDESGKNGALYRELTAYLNQTSSLEAMALAQQCTPRAPLYSGVTQTVRQLDITALRRYHQRHYRPHKALLLTSGHWPMVALWHQLSKTLQDVSGEALPVPASSLRWASKDDKSSHVVTLSVSPVWATALHPTLSTPRCQRQLRTIGAELLALSNEFLPTPALRFRLSSHAEPETLQRYVDDVARRMPARRAHWQSRYHAIRAGQEMAQLWGDGLQRLYHSFALTPFAPHFLRADSDVPSLSNLRSMPGKGEWQAPCPPLLRMAILCRVSARDHQTREVLSRWLTLCQQRTLRWTWTQGNALIGGTGEWQCANVVVMGYTVDLPVDDADALRAFWHHQLSGVEIDALDAEWQHSANGLSLCVRGSVPVFRTGAIMVSHRDDSDAMQVTLAFPHSVETGDMATFAQAVMGTSMMKKRRLGGRCASLNVDVDLLSYELTFESVADSDPGVTFIALMNAIESLAAPLDEAVLERHCQGGLGLVSSRYNKSNAGFHKALLEMVGQSPAVDFSQVTPASVSELAFKVLRALKHPTVH